MDNYGFFDSTVESELSLTGVYASVTKGTSMRPLFKTNRDMVILRRADNEPKKYDVVLYRTRGGKYILHRIVKVHRDSFVIRGDNTFVPECVDKGMILAVLTEFNRKGRRHSVTDIGYRLYSHIWTFIYPVRFLVHKALRLAYLIYRRIFRKNRDTP